MVKIVVVWSRRSFLREGETTDQEGFSLVEFSFVNGTRSRILAKRIDGYENSCWQKQPFSSTPYMTKVEIWKVDDECFFIYAEPSEQIKEKL